MADVDLEIIKNFNELNREEISEVWKNKKWIREIEGFDGPYVGFYYKDISTYLIGRGFKSRRNKILNSKLVERMLKKRMKYKEKLKVKILDIKDVKLVDDRIGMYCKIENGEIGDL